MNSLAARLHRLVLRAYPAEFRREYGTEMTRTVLDKRRHEARSTWRILVDELFDAARAAPAMRWESPMNRLVMSALAATAAVAALVLGGPVAVVAAALALLAGVLWWRRQDRPVTASPSRRGAGLLGAGLVAIGAAVAIPAVDGGELSEGWWAVFAVLLLGGMALATVGAVLALDRRAHRLARPPHA